VITVNLRLMLFACAIFGLAQLACYKSVVANEFDIDLRQLNEITPPPGFRINGDNIDRYAAIVDRELATFVRQGWVTLSVGELTSFRPHAAYITATAQYGGSAKLDDPGILANYQGGRPFPSSPDRNDPRAGEKIAWNIRVMYNGDNGIVPEMHLQYRDLRDNTINRSLIFEAKLMRFMYRHVVPPIPSVNKNLQNSLGAFYMNAVSAGDLTGAEILAFFNRDDSEARKGWVYIPQLRRSQSLGSFPPRETMFGSDILPDDFLGYAGRIVDMDWNYIGSTYVLLPMYRHDQIVVTETKASRSNYRFTHFHGKGTCFPNITWQLRHAHIVEGIPSIDDYPVSKRYMYVDSQTYYPALVKIYDESGRFWKLTINGVAHPNSHVPENHETGAPIVDSASTIDVSNNRCTTVQLLSMVNVDGIKVQDFDPANLGGGRHGRRR
jgi:hypothetical protein